MRFDHNEETHDPDDDGFIILDGKPLRPQPEEPSRPKQKGRRYSDDFLSGTCRIGCETHMVEPIFKNGKETGLWRAYRIRGFNIYEFKLGAEVPWDVILASEESVREWAKTF